MSDIKPFVYVPPKDIWYVNIEQDEGRWLNVYTGPSHDKAIQRTNFWDERVNTRIYSDLAPKGALAVAMNKFDQLERWLQTV